MAKGTAHCTCKKCGSEFIREKKCYNRREADDWVFWAENNYTLCGKCYAEEQKEIENAKDLYVDVRINSRAAFSSGHENNIAIIFGGNTKPRKDEIKAIGAHWTDDYPEQGVLGDLIGMNRKNFRWVIYCGLDELEDKFKQLEALGARINSMPTETDIAIYKRMEKERREKDAEKAALNAKELEALGEIPAWPEEISKLWPESAKWNGKFYGASGRWRVYFSGEEVRLSNDQKKAMEETLFKRQEWRKRKEQIDKGSY